MSGKVEAQMEGTSHPLEHSYPFELWPTSMIP